MLMTACFGVMMGAMASQGWGRRAPEAWNFLGLRLTLVVLGLLSLWRL